MLVLILTVSRRKVDANVDFSRERHMESFLGWAIAASTRVLQVRKKKNIVITLAIVIPT